MKRVLIIAYACEPYRGSEPGIGWKWALQLALSNRYDVYVITRCNNKPVVDRHDKEFGMPKNLHVFYYDLPDSILWWKHHGLPVNLYYAWWLNGVTNFAKKLHAQYHFDLAHHLTFGVFRDPCPLYKMGVPYVIGPVGGGEETPTQLVSIFSLKQRITERIRGFANNIAFFNPKLHRTFNNANLILCKTKDTKEVLSKWNEKTVVNLEIGIYEVNRSTVVRDKNLFLYVGRFTYWKGVRLVLDAFRKYSMNMPDVKLRMIGKGEMANEIKKYAETHKLNIEVIPWIQQEELKKYYSTARAMLFPSLHDSSGNVVLESLSFGLPVICLDCGGPASILGETMKETIVPTTDRSVDNVVDALAERMRLMSSDDKLYSDVQENAYKRAEALLWDKTVLDSYSLIERSISEK